MINLRSLPLCVLAGALVFPLSSPAQQAAPAVRIANPIDESQRITLTGNVNPQANARNDRGPVSPGFAMPDLTLILSRSAEQQQAFEAFIQSQYDSSSPNYHQWLTPSQIGAQYGPAPADIATITGWLASHGFTVNRVTPDGMTIHFSGTASQVEGAFHTEIHNLSVNGEWHYANMTDPQVPAALAPVVVGIKALHNFLPKPQHKLGSKVQFNTEAGKWQRVATAAGTPLLPSSASSAAPGSGANPASGAHPMYGINGNCGTGCTYLEEDVGPYDFATIYNVLPLWNASTPINGSGQTIAIAGTSLICLSATAPCTQNDVAAFRSEFGLPAGLTPNQIDAGSYFSTGTTATVCNSTAATAACGVGDLEENSLDVEESGAVAPAAQIDLVVTGQSASCNAATGAGCIDTLYDSAAYVVQNATAKILSVSYGECELGQGTAGNVAYYDLWQQAAAEGISVFASTGDSGSPSCDDGQDGTYGNPYIAQYGLSVSGIASTPYNTAVGGTDFSWCQPYVTQTGTGSSAVLNLSGCPASSTTQGSPAYWNTSNNGTTGASAANYVPEIPWNDTCLNPINARYIETYLNLSGFDAFYSVNPTTPEEACNDIYSDTIASYGGYPGWYLFYEGTQDDSLAFFVDTVGGSGGASGCVANSTSSTGTALGACTTGATSTGATSNPVTGAPQASLTLVNDGWPKPSWQSGITGIPSDGVRDIPDVSFFAGNGSFDSSTLICVSLLGSCALSSTAENTAQEVGGTSVATPQMAGVMALINQKAGAPQGLAGPELYNLAGRQNYSQCSAESVTSSSSCYFQDIDSGPTAPTGPAYTTSQTIAMPCNLSGTYEGGIVQTASGPSIYNPFAGTPSLNCYAFNTGDSLGTLGTSSSTAAYNAGTGFDLATGLGSLNVANVVNAWVSDTGTGSTTITVKATPTTITINQALSVAVTVAGSGATPTGDVVLTGGGYSANQALSSGASAFNVPANSLTAGSLTLTVDYGGDANYAANSATVSVTVNVMTPTVGVSAPSTGNVANPTNVNVTVTGPAGATATPTGTVNLKSGTYTSSTAALSSGAATITIPASTLTVGTDTITADYSGDSNYAGQTGTAQITISQTATLTPTVRVTPTPSAVDSGQSLSIAVAVSGSGVTPTGTVILTTGTYSSGATTLAGGAANITIMPNTLSVGSDTLTASYSGDANYAAGSGTAAITVTQSTYSLAATTPAAVSPGTSATSTITGTTSGTDYTGTVALSTCTLMSSSVTNPSSPPSCSAAGSITFASGAATGSGTATVTTTAASADLIRPIFGNGKGWLGAGSGAVLALMVFLGIPARRRSWRSMLTILAATVALGTLSSCGGGSSGGGGGGGGVSATSAGMYTFQVAGQGNDPAKTAENVTFILTVN